MKTSQAGIDLIKRFEGCRLTAYRLTGEKYYTCGYGHSGPDVTAGMTITQAQADKWLRDDLAKFERYVEKYVTAFTLTEQMNAALVSYCYNRGPKGMKQLADASPTPEAMTKNIVVYWGSATRYKDALLKRRYAEQELFLSGMKPGPYCKTVHDIALDVLKGWWGNGEERKRKLTQAGYDPVAVQREVNRILKEGE